MDDEKALARLKLLMKEDGALMIVTPFHACAGVDAARRPVGVTDDRMAAESDRSDLRRACAAYADRGGHTVGLPGGYREAGHYHLVPVKRLEPVEGSASGRYAAYGDDDLGTKIVGMPSALLRRLTEHEGG